MAPSYPRFLRAPGLLLVRIEVWDWGWLPPSPWQCCMQGCLPGLALLPALPGVTLKNFAQHHQTCLAAFWRGPGRPRKRGCTEQPEGLGYLILGRPDGPATCRSATQPVAAYGTESSVAGSGSLACRLRCVRPARRPRAHSV